MHLAIKVTLNSFTIVLQLDKFLKVFWPTHMTRSLQWHFGTKFLLFMPFSCFENNGKILNEN